jgi:hypothetical protein
VLNQKLLCHSHADLTNRAKDIPTTVHLSEEAGHSPDLKSTEHADHLRSLGRLWINCTLHVDHALEPLKTVEDAGQRNSHGATPPNSPQCGMLHTYGLHPKLQMLLAEISVTEDSFLNYGKSLASLPSPGSSNWLCLIHVQQPFKY